MWTGGLGPDGVCFLFFSDGSRDDPPTGRDPPLAAPPPPPVVRGVLVQLVVASTKGDKREGDTIIPTFVDKREGDFRKDFNFLY